MEPQLLARLGAVTRTLLAVLLILLLLFVAMPLGMASEMCPNSHASACTSPLGICAAMLGLIVLVMLGALGTINEHTPHPIVLLLDRSLKRPPRSSSR